MSGRDITVIDGPALVLGLIRRGNLARSRARQSVAEAACARQCDVLLHDLDAARGFKRASVWAPPPGVLP